MPVAATVVVLVLLAVGLALRYAFYTSPDQAAVAAAPRISDVRFEQAASGVCHQYALVFDTATTLGDQPTRAQTAHFLETIAATFDAMVARLRQLPVTVPADRPVIEQWLAAWEAYDAFGHQYAAAVAKGAEQPLIAQDSGSQGRLRRTRNAFANANHMKACAFN